jgi:hypothetical protein
MRPTVPVWLLAEDEFGTGRTVCRRTRGCLKLLDLVVAMIVHQMILRQAEALSRFEQDERVGQLELVIRPAQPPLCVGDGVRLAKVLDGGALRRDSRAILDPFFSAGGDLEHATHRRLL